ncbi:MAG: hypothetical protein M3209_03045 [Acidobacteriota bacterium]|nr:hypothetical protein [Acidobacteriota bacterium]
MLSFLSGIFTKKPQIEKPYNSILERLLAAAGKPGWNSEIQRTLNELSEIDSQSQIEFVLAALDWSYGKDFNLDEETVWTVFQVLVGVLSRIEEFDTNKQHYFVVSLVKWMSNHPQRNIPAFSGSWNSSSIHLAANSTIQKIIKHQLPFEHDDLVALVSWSISQPANYYRSVPEMIKAIRNYLKRNELTLSLKSKILELAEVVARESYSNAENRKWNARLKELAGSSVSQIPLIAGDAWSDVAIADIESFNSEKKAA